MTKFTSLPYNIRQSDIFIFYIKLYDCDLKYSVTIDN